MEVFNFALSNYFLSLFEKNVQEKYFLVTQEDGRRYRANTQKALQSFMETTSETIKSIEFIVITPQGASENKQFILCNSLKNSKER